MPARRQAPFFLALIVLLGSYGIRNEVARAPLERFAAEALRESLGYPVAVEIDGLGGTWFSDFRVIGLSLHSSRGAVRSFEAHEIALTYLLPQFLGESPEDAFTTVSIRDGALDVDLSEPSRTDRPVHGAPGARDPAALIANVLERFPHRLRIETDVRARVQTGAGHTIRGDLVLSGSGAEGIATRLTLPGEQEILPWDETALVPVSVALSRRSVTVTPQVTAAGGESGEHPPTMAPGGENNRRVRLAGALALDQERRRVESIAVDLAAAPLFLSLQASPSSASLRAAFEPQRPTRIETPLLPQIRQGRLGPTSLSLRYEQTRAESQPVTEQLLSAPWEMLNNGRLDLTGSVEQSRVGGLDALETRVSAALEGEILSLEELRLAAEGGVSIDAAGESNLRSGSFSLPRLRATVPSLRRLRPVIADRANWARQLAGSFDAEGSLEGDLRARGPEAFLRTLSGAIDIRAADLRVADLEVDRFTLSSTLDAGSIELRRLVAEGSGLRIESNSTLALEPGRRTITVDSAELAIVDGITQTFLLASPTQATFSPEEIRLAETLFRSEIGTVRLEGTLDARGIHGSFSGRRVSAAPIGRVAGLPEEVEGYLSFSGTVDGELRQPRLSVELRTEELRYNGVATELTLRARQNGGALRLEEFRLTQPPEFNLQASGTLPLRLTAHGLLPLNLHSAALTLSGSHERPGKLLPKGYADYLPTERATLEANLTERSGDLRLEALLRARGGEQERPTVRLSVRLREALGDRLVFESALRVDGEKAASVAGQLSVPGLSAAEPVIDPREVAVEGTAELSFPLREVAARLPSVIFAGGRLLGEVRFYGALAQLKYAGALETLQSELRLAGPLPPVTALRGEIALRTGEAEIRELRGELGRAPFTASGTLLLPEGAGETKVSLRVQGDNLLLYSDDSLRVRGDTRIEVSRSLQAPLISGELTLREAVYEEDIPLIDVSSPPAIDPEALQLFAFRGDWAGETALDISVEGDRAILVRNNLLETELSVDLHLRGSLQVPIMTGRIFTQEAALRLPVTTVDLSQMAVEFPPGDPFRPTISAVGNSQIRGYNLLVRASGRVPAVEVEVSSTPPLPRDQALLLLTTGYADLGELGPGERTVRALGRFVGRQLIEVLLAEREAEEAVADRVEVRVGRQLSESGSEVIEVEFQLTEEERWFLEFERDRFDAYNLGVTWRLWFN